AGCHGDELDGGSGPPLTETDLPKDAIEDSEEDGIGDMPPDIFQGSDEELDDLSDLLFQLPKVMRLTVMTIMMIMTIVIMITKKKIKHMEHLYHENGKDALFYHILFLQSR